MEAPLSSRNKLIAFNGPADAASIPFTEDKSPAIWNEILRRERNKYNQTHEKGHTKELIPAEISFQLLVNFPTT